eukprot:m.18361 g.18361  ORF g.18361 m.18361 type:complete len:255 (+) comp10792_c0_seq2:50-814(+)
MKGAWAVFLALLATFEPVQPQEYALVVVNDDQDAMSAAGFQRSVRRFCVELRSVTEVEDNEEWASCKEPVTIYQSWNSMGLSCVVWPAATFLAAQLPNIVTFKDVILELGAGTGFTGIATAQSVPGLHAILTDRELAVPCLEANHAANGNSSRVHVAVLDWQQPLPSLPVTPTYIVAADVVYEEALFEPLIATLSALSRKYQDVTVLLAAQQRYPKRLRRFVRLARQQFEVTLVATEETTHCKLYSLKLTSVDM